jgi:hypothetical protein
VDLRVVETDQARVRAIIERYEPKDQINTDKTALFAYAPPDVGLATKQMSGKKKEKFCITLLFLCNQTGTKKWKIFFIGRSKKPRCFKNKSQKALVSSMRTTRKHG